MKFLFFTLLAIFVWPFSSRAFDCAATLENIKIKKGTGFSVNGPGFIIAPMGMSDLKQGLVEDLNKAKKTADQWRKKFPRLAKNLSRNWMRYQHADPQNWSAELESLKEVGFAEANIEKMRQHIELVTALLNRELPEGEPPIFFSGMDLRWADKDSKAVGDTAFHTDKTYITVLAYVDGPGLLIKKKDGTIVSAETGDVAALTGEKRSAAYWRKRKRVKPTSHASPEWVGDRLIIVLYFSI